MIAPRRARTFKAITRAVAVSVPENHLVTKPCGKFKFDFATVTGSQRDTRRNMTAT